MPSPIPVRILASPQDSLPAEMAAIYVGATGPKGDPGADGTAATDALAATLGTAATLDVGTTAGTVAAGDDARFTDARPPTGGAGGVLSGSYPNPGFAADMATQAELDAAVALRIAATEKGAANGVATLGADAKIPATQLPAIAITDTFVVATQEAMLALTAERGDIAVRSDLKKTFALAAEPATTLGNWVELQTPTDAVLSVAGRTGAIVLTVADIATLQGILDSKAPLTGGGTSGTWPIAITGESGSSPWGALTGMPAYIAAGATASDARAAIGAGTSSLALGTTAGTAKEGDYAPAWSDVTAMPTVIAAGADTATARAAIGLGTLATQNVDSVQLYSTGGSITPVLAVENIHNRTVAASDIPTTVNIALTDTSTAGRLSAQIFRFTYTYNGTGLPAAFDAMAVFTPVIQQGFSAVLLGIVLEGPRVSPGKTLYSYTGLKIDAASGTVTKKVAIETSAGAGPSLFNTGVDNERDTVQVGGSMSCAGPLAIGKYVKASLPSASVYSGCIIEVSDATGGPKICRSNGTVWQLLNTATTVS